MCCQPPFTSAQRQYHLTRALDAVSPQDRREHLYFWFQTRDINEIRLENVADFHSFNWFGKSLDRLTDDEREEATQIAESFAGSSSDVKLSEIKPGRNPNIKPALLWYV